MTRLTLRQCAPAFLQRVTDFGVNDHSGELKSFPNAKIYVNAEELSAEQLQGYENLEAKRVIDLDNPVPTVFAIEVDVKVKCI